MVCNYVCVRMNESAVSACVCVGERERVCVWVVCKGLYARVLQFSMHTSCQDNEVQQSFVKYCHSYALITQHVSQKV